MKNSSLIKSMAPLIILVACIVAAGIMIMSKKPPERKPIEEKAFLVDAKSMSLEDVEFTVQSQGNVLPKHQTVISAQVGGTVVAVAPIFEEGGMFKQGDVLVTLEQDDYQTDVMLAEAELAQAEAALQEEIARGKVAENEWRSVKSVVPPELGLRKPQLAKEQANVKAAQAKLARAKRNLKRTEIRAPYNGIVVSRDIDLGQYISVGSTIGEVYSTQVAEVRLPLTDNDLSFIDLNKGVASGNRVAVSARVGGKPQTWYGKLVRTEGVLNASNRLIYAVAEIDDPYQRNGDANGPILRFGQFVQAEISGTQSESLLVLPRNLLRLDNSVLVVTPDNELAIRPVNVVRSEVDNVYIGSGIKPTDKVVVSAVPNPFDGMKVRLLGETPKSEKPALASNEQAETE